MNQANNHNDFQPLFSNVLSVEECLKYADETKDLVLKKDALKEIPGLLSKYYEYDAVCLIADENTFTAAGQKVKDIMEGAGIAVSGVHVFPAEPRLHAEYGHIRFLRQWISSLRGFPRMVPVAAGAGTLNDLVKLASTELELPYLCVPTASSVDGFTPSGAALLMDGFKQTLPCKAPRTLAADTEVIARAPAYLSSSGFGDLASKIIAGTDWIIADKAGSLGAPEAPAINPVAWGMVQNGLLDTLERSVNAAKGDKDAVNSLFQALAVTGFAMQYMKNPRPVSGAEHLWSHVWEMEDLCFNGVPVTHGHKVTIGTLAAAAFTEIFFEDPEGPPVPPKGYRRPGRDERKAEVSAVFKSSRAHDKIIEAAMAKLMDEKTAEIINQAFRDSWKDIRGRVLEKLLPYGELKNLLSRAECPLRPEDIGISRTEAITTARRAQMIRNKYSIVDLAWDMGVYETILERIGKSDIYLR
jgi:glycerol-1-phosphate dehydrogenase [NAD(P)+]